MSISAVLSMANLIKRAEGKGRNYSCGQNSNSCHYCERSLQLKLDRSNLIRYSPRNIFPNTRMKLPWSYSRVLITITPWTTLFRGNRSSRYATLYTYIKWEVKCFDTYSSHPDDRRPTYRVNTERVSLTEHALTESWVSITLVRCDQPRGFVFRLWTTSWSVPRSRQHSSFKRLSRSERIRNHQDPWSDRGTVYLDSCDAFPTTDSLLSTSKAHTQLTQRLPQQSCNSQNRRQYEEGVHWPR